MRPAARWERLALVSLCSLAACELEETALVAPEDVLIVEAYVIAHEETTEAVVFLHRTLGSSGPPDPSGVRVSVTSDDGGVLVFTPRQAHSCVAGPPSGLAGTGTCFFGVTPPRRPPIRPGARVSLEIVTAEGESLTGATVLPGPFALEGVTEEAACSLPAATQAGLSWSAAPGTWAYFAESQLFGLGRALEPQGIVVEEEPIFLLGLAISEEDTAIRFPAEFGVFERFDLDRRLAAVLQEGMPADTRAEVVIAAGDRNVVNWVRGGDFNPSGLIRVPSLFGDGTGVIGSWVSRRVRIEVETEAAEGLTACPAAEGPAAASRP